MEVQTIRIGELRGWVESDAFRQMPVIPISPQRAISQAQNPRAKPDDVALVLVWSNGALVGYLGALPDLFFISGSEPQPAAWLSCIWVSPLHRGKGIAKIMLEHMLEAWQFRVVLTEYTPEVGHLYRQFKHFTESTPSGGFRGYLRPNFAQILPPKNPIFEKTKPLLRAADALLSVPNHLRIKCLHSKIKTPQTKEITDFDKAVATFISALQSGELAQRDPATLRWMLQYPWVRESPEPDDFDRRYHFTARARQFKTKALLVLEQGETIGFLLLTLRDGHLRVPHAWHGDEHTAQMARVVFAQAIEMGASTLSLYHPRLTRFCQITRTPFFWEKPLRRTYFVGKGLADMLQQQPLAFQDGDGDVGFT
jgi:GNAT superfamily N-acetyltransferase